MLLSNRTITLPNAASQIDWQAASKAIGAVHESAAIVEMDGWETNKGIFELPSEVQERLRPLSGTVIASGSKWGLVPGERVIVSRDLGMWLGGFSGGGYEAKGQVRVYGPCSPNSRHYIEGFGGIFAVIEEMNMRCIKDKVLIQMEKPVSSDMGLHLPDDSKYRPPTATVVSAGPEATLAKPGERGHVLKAGDKVLYNVLAVQQSLYGDGSKYGLDGEMTDYAFIRSADIYAVLGG